MSNQGSKLHFDCNTKGAIWSMGNEWKSGEMIGNRWNSETPNVGWLSESWKRTEEPSRTVTSCEHIISYHIISYHIISYLYLGTRASFSWKCQVLGWEGMGRASATCFNFPRHGLARLHQAAMGRWSPVPRFDYWTVPGVFQDCSIHLHILTAKPRGLEPHIGQIDSNRFLKILEVRCEASGSKIPATDKWLPLKPRPQICRSGGATWRRQELEITRVNRFHHVPPESIQKYPYSVDSMSIHILTVKQRYQLLRPLELYETFALDLAEIKPARCEKTSTGASSKATRSWCLAHPKSAWDFVEQL